jgi:hypothetical protein
MGLLSIQNRCFTVLRHNVAQVKTGFSKVAEGGWMIVAKA